jgi:hypothetical protein
MTHRDGPSGPIFSAAFSAASISTAGPSDLFFVTASTRSRVAVREVRLGQYSDAGDAQAEMLPITLLLGSTSAAVGSTITPRNVARHTGAPSAGTAVSAPSTTLSSTASAILMHADAMNIAAGWSYMPTAADRLVLNPGQKFTVRMGTPNDALSLNGTLTFEEIGTPSL